MHKLLFSIPLFLCVLNTASLLAQKRIKELDYTVAYLDHAIQIDFDDAAETNVRVSDAFTNATLPTQRNAASYTCNQIHPAQILKVEYTDHNSAVAKINYIATESASTGDMKVYFNHPVNTTYSQGYDAVNLGNTLDDKLIEYINACTATLDIAIYNSSSPSPTTGIAGAINAAYNRGVEVRVIYDGSTSSYMIGLLSASIPKIASPTDVTYGIMHNKFVIFDANNSDANKPLVWTGSTNWTSAQIDGPDNNNVIVIQDQTLALAYKMEFEEMWGSNTMVPNTINAKFGPYKTDNTPHNFIIGGKQVQSYFSPSDNTNYKIIDAINSANSDIDIATMLITRSDIKTAILNKFNGGLTDINLVVDSQNPSGNQFPAIQSGITVDHAVILSQSGIMHHKFMVVDNFNTASDPLVVLGSHNWSSAAQTKNDENTLIVHDAAIANQYFQAFAYLYLTAGGVFSSHLAVTTPSETAQDSILVPNPTSGVFQIQNPSGIELKNTTITITDLVGKTIVSKKYATFNSEIITLENQPAGLYFVQVQNENRTSHYKVLKQ